ncbi:MAG: hypothetical protein NTX72_00915 [Candidatus Uhrbacteria bacterium]|nr:hypothetical protein [Candidatus Uhrbacteria bacterium]
MASPVRYSVRFLPPPGFDKVVDGLKNHGLVRKHGYVKLDAMRSIALAADRLGYKAKCQVAELRNFLVSAAVLIDDGSQKYYFDAERADVVLVCCDKREDIPTGVHPQQRLKFLKFNHSTRRNKHVNAEPDQVPDLNTDAVASTEVHQSRVRWTIRFTPEQAKIFLSIAAGIMKKGVSTALTAWATDPLKNIGLLIKRGDRRLAVWECDHTILHQCRFEMYPRENHRGISIVQDVADGPVVASGQWQKDLEAIMEGKTAELIELAPVQVAEVAEPAVIVCDPEVTVCVPEVLDRQLDTLPQIRTDLLPVQYELIMQTPESLSDDQLEEAMLAILVLSASLKNRHEALVSVKKARVQKAINDVLAEQTRLDEEIQGLRTREQELENAKATNDARIASLQQNMPQ